MSKTSQDRGPPSITKMIEGMAHRHHKWTVFGDFVEMAAISVSNAVDLRNRDKREARYMEIVKGYERDEVQKFPEMMGALTLKLEEGFDDVLGRTYHQLELHNKWTGQFFSPYPLCKMMALMTVGDTDPKAIIEERGYLTAMEPCCGSGAMVIALADALKEGGINYQQHLHVTAIDVDLKCVHITFIQLSLLHIPATIIHGNALSVEEWDTWHTPAHIMGGWDWKLRNARKSEGRGIPVAPAPELPEAAERPPTPTIADAVQPSQLTLF
jgi:hypothetical protein